jgi:hypothetical protein
MPNPVKGEVPLKLSDGRDFALVLDMEAMLSVEQNYGKPLPKVMADASEGYLSAIAAIAQAAFIRFHPEVTRSDVLDIMMSDRDALVDALSKASDAAFPDAKPSTEGNAPRPRGKASGSSGAKPA